MNTRLVIGLMPESRVRELMLATASGKYKLKPSDPKVWLTSMKSLAEILSDDNGALLRVIEDARPESINGLAELTGRKASNLSRTLKTMSGYGLVEMV